MTLAEPPLLALHGVGKSFFGVPALADVTLEIGAGSVLGLVGENGAGKSTLMNIIGGVLRPDTGQMELAGEAYAPLGPGDATRAGVAFIHQELNLFGNLTIAENIFVGDFPRRAFGFVDRPAMRRRSRDLLDRLDIKVSPDTLIEELAPGERQLVEIAKALHGDARLIIFDEPTTSLTARETDRLFEIIERLRAEGRTLVYISHILTDVMRLADTIAVLRDGRLVTDGPQRDFDIPKLIRSMIGRELKQLFPPRSALPQAAPVLEVEGLSQPGIVKDVGFSLRRGEILGLFGLMGSGRTELARILFGLDEASSGSITIAGRRRGATRGLRPERSIRDGLAFVTENRREEGLMMEASIADNVALVSLEAYARTPLRIVDRTALGGAVRDATATMRVKAANFDRQPVKSLSGGNQQKVVLAKWLLNRPTVFILDEPTRGVDVGAKYEIYTITDHLAAEGNGVLFISSELDELIAMCDRILVMSRGEIWGEFDRKPFVREAIMHAAFRDNRPLDSAADPAPGSAP